jgi:hypothetical protein
MDLRLRRRNQPSAPAGVTTTSPRPTARCSFRAMVAVVCEDLLYTDQGSPIAIVIVSTRRSHMNVWIASYTPVHSMNCDYEKWSAHHCERNGCPPDSERKQETCQKYRSQRPQNPILGCSRKPITYRAHAIASRGFRLDSVQSRERLAILLLSDCTFPWPQSRIFLNDCHRPPIYYWREPDYTDDTEPSWRD